MEQALQVGPAFVEVAACSYEGSLFGWRVNEQSKKSSEKVEDEVDDNDDTPGLDATMTYGFSCCQGSLKCIAVSSNGKYLATGGMSERIHIFNIKENKTLGELSGHSGAITSLQFVEDSFLISGSEDNTIIIWNCSDWEQVHVLGGHKGCINGIAVHPTGKLALTVSKDNTMKLWNLVLGRCAFTRRLKGPADNVKWHVSGSYYMLLVSLEVQVYLASDNSCVGTTKFKSRVNQSIFITRYDKTDALVSICDDKCLYVHKLDGTSIATVNIGNLGSRPKDIWSCNPSLDALKNIELRKALEGENECITVITSAGRVGVFSGEALCNGEDMESSLLTSTNVKVEPRLTAVVSWAPKNAITKLEEKGPRSKREGRDEGRDSRVEEKGRGGRKIDENDTKKLKKKVKLNI